MIIFLYGQDTYRLQQKLREIEARYKKIHQSGLNLEKITVTEIDFREFWEKLQQPSMFIKKKLLFLENVFSNQKFKEEFLKKIKEIADAGDIVVVFEKEKINSGDKFFLALKKHSKSQEFKPLAGQQLFRWAKKEFEKYEATIEEGALKKLIDFVGNNLWQLANEIKKLLTYKAKQRSDLCQQLTEVRPLEIYDRDVELLVRPKIETAIFETIDALAARNKKKALRLLQKHLEKGDSPFYLLKMINFQFRNLLVLQSCELGYEFYANYANVKMMAKKLDMHPFVLRKTAQQMSRFSLQELKKIYQRIFAADFEIKTGKVSPAEGIKLLIAQI